MIDTHVPYNEYMDKWTSDLVVGRASSTSNPWPYRYYGLFGEEPPSIPAYPTVNQVLGRTVKKVIFSGPATIVLWADGTKTIAKCSENDVYDPEKGLMMAILKKFVDVPTLKRLMKKYCPKEEEEPLPNDWVGGHVFQASLDNIKKNLAGLSKKLGGGDPQ